MITHASIWCINVLKCLFWKWTTWSHILSKSHKTGHYKTVQVFQNTDECSILDIKIAEKLAEKKEGAGNGNVQSFIELVEKMSHVEKRIEKLNDELLLIMK